ncbi:hypothetical protein CRYUN_Cryun13aG0047600 [Craigia yunnanensis]
MDGHSEMGLIGENFDPGLVGRMKGDGYESRSRSDNFEGASGDDQDFADDGPPKKKKYHSCDGPAMPDEISYEQHHLRIETARLKDELSWICNTLPMGFDFGDGAMMPLMKPMANELPYDRSAFVDVALAAMSELIKMWQMDNPLWVKGLDETLLDANRWAEIFLCMISRAATNDVQSSGMGVTRDNALQVMDAELQVLSPLVPVRQVRFVRFCE